ncbi:MAG: Flagellar assembly factor FliW [Actinomycetia bacterium]|nr:Flagellar assembly factor FliW [Actinomycetes bacterium]
METPVIEMAAGLPGFPDARRFMLVEWGEQGSPFSLLRSLDHDALEFLVAAPVVLFPDYAPEIDDTSADTLGLTTAEDALVLVIVTIGESAETATANLLAPVVVNIKTRMGAQIVLPEAPVEDLRRPLWSKTPALV